MDYPLQTLSSKTNTRKRPINHNLESKVDMMISQSLASLFKLLKYYQIWFN